MNTEEVNAEVRNGIPICYRNSESGKLEIASVEYGGPLSAETMRKVNKLFLKKAEGGYFFPLEPMDAYHDMWRELERKAENLPELTKATPHTYLCAAARLIFLNWFSRKVAPARKMYRKIEDLHYGKKGATGIDDFDIDNYDGTNEAPSNTMVLASDRGDGECLEETEDFSSQLHGENLAVAYNVTPGRANAREVLSVLFPHLPEEVVRAFCAYIQSDGVFPVAAHLAGIPKTTYYRKWPRYIAFAKKVGNFLGVSDTN